MGLVYTHIAGKAALFCLTEAVNVDPQKGQKSN